MNNQTIFLTVIIAAAVIAILIAMP